MSCFSYFISVEYVLPGFHKPHGVTEQVTLPLRLLSYFSRFLVSSEIVGLVISQLQSYVLYQLSSKKCLLKSQSAWLRRTNQMLLNIYFVQIKELILRQTVNEDQLDVFGSEMMNFIFLSLLVTFVSLKCFEFPYWF